MGLLDVDGEPDGIQGDHEEREDFKGLRPDSLRAANCGAFLQPVALLLDRSTH